MPLEVIIKALQAAVVDANVVHGENSHEAYYAIESVVAIAENLAAYLAAQDPNFDAEAFIALASTPNTDAIKNFS